MYAVALSLEDLWIGEMRGLILDGKRVLLIRTEKDVRAYEDRCAHLGMPLSEGTFDLEGGCVLTCSAHFWQYDACTGKGLNPSNVCLRRFPVRIENGAVLVDVHGELS